MTVTVAPVRVDPVFRALTIRQPWAEAILHHGKAVENRTWGTSYRGLLLIHASARMTRDDRADATSLAAKILPRNRDAAFKDFCHTIRGGVPLGAVVGVARLVGAHQECPGDCSPWAMPGQWHWQLERVSALDEPIPAKGRLGLWTPGPDLEKRVMDAGYGL